ncbi:hypothetical protein [Methanobacterium sp. ACI-7]
MQKTVPVKTMFLRVKMKNFNKMKVVPTKKGKDLCEDMKGCCE